MSEGMSAARKVYEAINRITARLAKVGIGKDRENVDQKFMFRGVDDIFNALAPMLAEEKLCILPNVTAREVASRPTKSGGTTYNVVVKVEYSFVSAEDGSTHVVTAWGEANDSQDKATAKAMSAAYKNACIEAFCIPTEGDNDPDAHGDEAWEKDVAQFLHAIDTAADMKEAKTIYKDAIKICRQHEDVAAAGKIKEKLVEKWPKAMEKEAA